MHCIKTRHPRDILYTSPSIKYLCFVTLSAIVNTLVGGETHFCPLCLGIWNKKYQPKPNNYQANFILSNDPHGLSLFQIKECIWCNFPSSCHRGSGQLNTPKVENLGHCSLYSAQEGYIMIEKWVKHDRISFSLLDISAIGISYLLLHNYPKSQRLKTANIYYFIELLWVMNLRVTEWFWLRVS